MILGGIGQFFPIGLYGHSLLAHSVFRACKPNLSTSQIIVGCYVILFGAGEPKQSTSASPANTDEFLRFSDAST